MYALAQTAELEGVTDLCPVDTEVQPFYYSFKVQCTSCRETHPNVVSFNRFEQNEISGSRGEANFVWKCQNCKRVSTATIISAPKSYPHQSPPKPQNILEFDCRGLEFVEFQPDGDWSAKGIESGTKFEEIDMTDDWYDYDEKAGGEVSIKDAKWEIRRA